MLVLVVSLPGRETTKLANCNLCELNFELDLVKCELAQHCLYIALMNNCLVST